MQALSRREETEVIDIARKEAHQACDDVVKEFAACSAGRTVTMPFVCRSQMKAMNQCLKNYMNEEKLDTLKLDYIAQRSEKGRAAVEKLRQERSSYLQKAYRKGKDGAQEDIAKI